MSLHRLVQPYSDAGSMSAGEGEQRLLTATVARPGSREGARRSLVGEEEGV
jgi:hypothetical protein